MRQKEFLGRGSIRYVKDIVEACNAKSVLLVTGKKSYQQSSAEGKLRSLLKHINVVRFCEFEPNPKLEDACLGLRLLKKNTFDLIIAIGGGSVIDMAKLVNILSCQKNNSPTEIVLDGNLIQCKGLPLVAIPTTSGTGSEATHFAVVYINGVKYSVVHEYVLPGYVIIDPIFTYNLPVHVMACSGLDALSQAIESFWAVGSTVQSKNYARKAIRILVDNIKNAVCNRDKCALDQMAMASNLAGKAINISKTTAAHAISYPITTHFNVPHGHAVALTLGKFFIINSTLQNSNIIDKRGKSYLEETMQELFLLLGCDNAKECCEWWFALMRALGLQEKINDVGVNSSDDINVILYNVNLERLNNNPVRLGSESLSFALSYSCCM